MYRSIRGAPAALATGFLLLGLGPLPVDASSIFDNTVTIGSAQVGNSFLVDSDGSVESTFVDGLASSAQSTRDGFVTNNSSREAELAFNILLENTTSDGITFRTSVLGFDANPDVDIGDSNVLESFNDVRTGRFPNGFGAIEICLLDTLGNARKCRDRVNTEVFTRQINDFNNILPESLNFRRIIEETAQQRVGFFVIDIGHVINEPVWGTKAEGIDIHRFNIRA